uniref:Globin domain-containing protein n=1 Tax=Entomoneis paludosa TaxID=265537 RepID=A0A7S2VCN9_9STRA|mmetsp:Transcript_16878/g.34867  ORF Transcript_16878/g.34867 Transcript_16878/m.34867 type:complete len:531 (+) Transcript_16878:192-1784(+)
MSSSSMSVSSRRSSGSSASAAPRRSSVNASVIKAAAAAVAESDDASPISKVHLPTSMRQRVLESWHLVENDLDALGMDFFLTIFKKHPALKDLFQFGGLATEDLHKSKILQAHASGVMKTVGVALAGLEDMESLIPVLRNLGRIHSLVGVQPGDYDLIYTVLIDTIKKHVGPGVWTSQIQEAWELCYVVITSVMKDPSRHLEVEPAEGWGLWNACVCAYLAVVSPLQLAGFGTANDMWTIGFMIMNCVAMLTCLLDLSSDVLQQLVSLKTSKGDEKRLSSERLRYWFAIKFRLNRFIRKFRLSRWVPWIQLDTLVLVSFAASFVLPESAPLAARYVIGLLPLATISRLMHFLKCAELMSLKRPDVDVEHFHYAQLIQLFVALVYMIHLFGCMYCMVTELESENARSGDGEDAFSPSLPHILEKGHMFNGYLHAAYWAFVNVAGIGNYDSAPETSLQILFTMIVHSIGATFYAIAAGNIFAILEARAVQFSEVSEGVASLKEFMQQCNIPAPSQDKFLSSYLMHNLVANNE